MLHGRYAAADETRQLEQSYIVTINKIKRSYRLLRRRARSHSIPVTTTHRYLPQLLVVEVQAVQ